ncbi:3-dehydroshikimate dehydratase [Plectosphaerella plurivora]|uniref:3-dehydroshikimate dehydratase n=1 Tax=Plectosphaerella plurivora TaxID=936078 RepID=A0A9P9AAP3_9PEZI|nr:3-dehydroshikimate dehydratase [Plectosphaerella plurivora]
MFKLAISSMSLGRGWAGHTLERRLDVAAKHGYRGIELWYEDLSDVAARHRGGATSAAALLAAAAYIRALCTARRLRVVCLQPFQHYEGLLDRDLHERRVDEMALWMTLAAVLGTDLVHIASNVLPAAEVSPDLALHVEDLQLLADLGAARDPPIRLSYEALAWGTRVDTWEQSWDMVLHVDRANFGLCLDTFNIAGRIFADPTTRSGRVLEDIDGEAVSRSMARLVASVDVSRVFFVQVVDAERLREPLVPGHAFHDPALPARMSWSRNCRLFYGEHSRGAYLPVRLIAAAIFGGLGFEGWVSLELFNRRMGDRDREVPEELGRRGAISWVKLVKDLELRVDGE